MAEEAKSLLDRGVDAVLDWLGISKDSGTSGTSSGLTKNKNEITDEDIENSILAQNLPVFIQRRKDREQKNSFYNNIILFNTKEPTKLKNLINSFDPKQVEPIFNLTNLQLSNLVPEIRIFKVYKKKGDEADKSKYLELELPFPNYTYKNQIEDIFSTRSGRGAGIGIKSFEWNSLAKNESNLAQFSAKLDLYLQDASEIMKVRNSYRSEESDFVYSVSVGDLIYPTIKEAGNLEAFEYDPKSSFLKIKVGWKLQNSENLDEKTKIDPKILNLLVAEYYLSIIKHDLQFNTDGSLNISINYIAAAEGVSDDFGRSDILFAGYKNRDSKDVEEKLSTLEKEAQSKIDNPNTSDSEKIKIKNTIKKTKSKIQLIEQNRSKRTIFKDFMTWLNQNKLIDYVHLSPEQVQSYRTLSEFDTKTLTVEDSRDVAKRIANAQKQVAQSKEKQLDLSELEAADVSATAGQSNEKEDEYKLNEKEITNAFVNSIRQKYETGNNGLVIPYFYLGDLFEYFSGMFLEQKFSLSPRVFCDDNSDNNSTIGFRNISNKNTRLVLGTFTYSDFGNPQIQYLNGGVLSRTKKIKIGDNTDKIQKTLVLTGKLEVANIAHVPISIRSFSTWFNNKILDSNLEKMSYNKFVREVIYNLVPANLSNQITRVVPKIKLRTLMNPTTIDDDAEFIQGTKVVDFLDSVHKKNYILNFDEEHRDPSANPFLHLKSKKAEYSLNKPSRSVETNLKNYIFVFSANESSSNFKKDFSDDLRNNIYHFYIGEETGMIKSIKFNREDNPRLDAHNIQAANKDNAQKIVRNVYHADLEMFGNCLLEPGSNIFINPTFPGVRLGDPILYQFGLGGYYNVIETSNKIEGGLFTTNIKTKWVSFGVDPNEVSILKDLSQVDQQDLAKFGIESDSPVKFN